MFYSKSGLTGTFDAHHFLLTWEMLLDQGIGTLFTSYDEAGSVEGMIGMILAPSMFDAKVTAQEAFWFVKPEARGLAGVRLFREVEKWAKEIKVERILMARLIGSMPEKVSDFYLSHGFTQVETSYVKDTSWQ